MVARSKLPSTIIRIGVAICGICATVTAQGQFIWNAPSFGGWSIPAHWQSAQPPQGGGANVTLSFSTYGWLSYTSTNDWGNPFALHSLFLNSVAQGLIIYGDPLNFMGAGASMVVTGRGDLILPGMKLTSDLTFSGDLTGTATFGAPLTGPGRLILDAPGLTTSFDKANTYAGGTELRSGYLKVFPAGSIGSGTLDYYGGVLSGELQSPIRLHSDFTSGSLSLEDGCSLTWLAPGLGETITDQFQINVEDDHSGPTLIKAGSVGFGPNGSWPSTSSITVTGGATLDMGAEGLGDRIGDTIPIHLDDGTVGLGNSGVASQFERLGPVTLSGGGKIYLGEQPEVNTNLEMERLIEEPGSYLNIIAWNLGQNPGPGTTNLVIDQPPALVGGNGPAGSPTISILPHIFATYDSGSFDVPDSLTTLGPNGVRPLNRDTEYSANFSGPSGSNVRISSTVNNEQDVQVNALVLGEGHNGANITGAGTIHIGSGTILTVWDSTIDNQIDFGSTPGFIGSPGTAATYSQGDLHGTAGVTFFGWVSLSGDNRGLTGPCTLRGGVSVDNMNNLPSGDGRIHMANGGLYFPPYGPHVVPKDIIVQGSGAVGGHPYPTYLTGTVSGDGDFTYAGLIVPQRANTYTGNTIIQEGQVVVPFDEVFGLGPEIDFVGDSGIQLSADWTTERNLKVSGQATFDTAGHDAILNGDLDCVYGSFSKVGEGTMTINGPILRAQYQNKVANGKLIVNGYAGGGVLDIDPSGESPATLGGVGYFDQVSIERAGILSPGSGGPGVFTVRTLDWLAGGVCEMDLGSSSDKVVIAYELHKGDNGLREFRFVPRPGIHLGTYVLMTYQFTGLTASDFSVDPASGIQGYFTVGDGAVKFTVTSIQTYPQSFSFYRGVYQTGGLADLDSSDDQYVVGMNGLTANGSEPPLSLVLTGTAPSGAQGTVTIHLEGHVSSPHLSQKIEMWSYTESRWVAIDQRAAPTTDQAVDVPFDATNYLEPGTNKFQGRISYFIAGLLNSSRWKGYFDQVYWQFGS